MRQMHWSWEQVQATPMYVRRYTADFLAMRNEATARAMQKR